MELYFVHGAFVRDGAWWWKPTADLLWEEAGIRSHAVALPSVGEVEGVGDAGLAEDAEALRAALDAGDGEAIVVGHSYGGTVLAELGGHPAVDRIVLISSYLPDEGESQSDIMSGEPDPVAVEPAGADALALSGFTLETFTDRFLHDVPVALRRGAWERTAPQTIRSLTTPVTNVGWKGVDSTYLVCTDDRSTSVELQRRHAARATRSVEIPTGHHPFLSRPDLVVEHLLRH